MMLYMRKAATVADLPDVAAAIIRELLPIDPFVVWLDGSMGAGKTTLTRYLLRALGLGKDEPVTSPTYALMNEYQIGNDWFAHLDLYRAEPHFSLAELGVLDARPFRGVFIEWAATPTAEERLAPTHRLGLQIVGDDRRDILLESRLS